MWVIIGLVFLGLAAAVFLVIVAWKMGTDSQWFE